MLTQIKYKHLQEVGGLEKRGTFHFMFQHAVNFQVTKQKRVTEKGTILTELS